MPCSDCSTPKKSTDAERGIIQCVGVDVLVPSVVIDRPEVVVGRREGEVCIHVYTPGNPYSQVSISMTPAEFAKLAEA